MRPRHHFPRDLQSACEFKFDADCKSRGKWCLGRIFSAAEISARSFLNPDPGSCPRGPAHGEVIFYSERFKWGTQVVFFSENSWFRNTNSLVWNLFWRFWFVCKMLWQNPKLIRAEMKLNLDGKMRIFDFDKKILWINFSKSWKRQENVNNFEILKNVESTFIEGNGALDRSNSEIAEKNRENTNFCISELENWTMKMQKFALWMPYFCKINVLQNSDFSKVGK